MTAVATILAFHAHPDDEVLFTGSTLARLAAEGHRVVIVVACAGGLGVGVNANPETRLAELRESASRPPCSACWAAANGSPSAARLPPRSAATSWRPSAAI